MRHHFHLISRNPELYGSVSNTLRKLLGVSAHVSRQDWSRPLQARSLPAGTIILVDADGVEGARLCECVTDEVAPHFAHIAIIDKRHPAAAQLKRMGLGPRVEPAPECDFRRALEEAVCDHLHWTLLQKVHADMSRPSKSRNPFWPNSRPPFGA